MRKGQTSIEYVLAMVGLMIMLIALYEISVSMSARLGVMQARMEGQRVAAQLGNTLDWAQVLGAGARININLYSFPAQHLIVNESEIVILDAEGQAVDFERHLGMINTQTTIYANSSIGVNNTRGNLTVAMIGS